MTAPEGWWKSVSPSGIRRAEDEAHAAGLTCPITAELFRDPVICAGDGYTYEREGVEKWFADGHDTSPMTGATLRTRHLVPNFNVRQRADQMRGGAPVGMTRSNDTAPSEPPPGATHASPSDVRPHEITPAEPTEPSAPPGPAASSKMKPDGGKGGGKGDDSKKGDESDGSPSLLDWVRGYPGVSGGPRRDQLDAYGWFDGNDGWRASRPLHRAAMRGDVDEIVRLIARERRDPNERMPEWFDSEPLGWAASFGHLDVVRKLVELGADPCRPANKAGNTPLCDARRERHVHVATFLEDYERRFRTQTMSRDERDAYELSVRSLAAKDLAGCWGCVAWPFFGACEYRRAEGQDVLWHEGICFPCLIPYREAWDRVGFTNTFRKRNSKDTIPYDPRNPGFFCFGSGCTWRWCK